MSATPLPTAWKRAADTLAPPRLALAPTDKYTEEELLEIAGDPQLWGPLHGFVEHRLTRDPVPWDQTILQRRMAVHYSYCQAANLPCRIITLKIRRGGGSTGAEGLLYVHLHNYRTRAGLIGTDYEVSANLMKMLKHFNTHDTFTGWPRAAKVIDDLVEWPNGSTCQRYTAENPEASRSAGLQAYHASEVSRWTDTPGTSAVQTLRSIRGSVPRSGFTIGIEESTANGAAGVFHDTFSKGRWPTHEELGCAPGEEWWRIWEHEFPQNVREMGGDLQFVRIFAGWFEDAEAQMPCTPDEAERIRDTLDKHEQELIARYLRPGPMGDRLGTMVETSVWQQLKWRREVIAEEFDGDREGFDQENPHSPASAFLSSGRHTFNRAGCLWMAEIAKVTPRRYGTLHRQEWGRVTFTETDRAAAEWIIYEEPREGYRYIMGVDTMSGEEQVKGSKTADYNAAVVLRAPFIDDDGRRRPARIVAALMPKDQSDPDVLARKTDDAHLWYGGCLIVFEVNNTGHGYKEHAKLRGMNLFMRQDTEKWSQETTEKIGWETNPKTRPQLISHLQAAIRQNAQESTRDQGIEVFDEETASECTIMVKDAKGVDKAPSGRHDDRIFALGMAFTNIGAATYFAGHRRRKAGPPDRKDWRKANVRR